jgi:DNA-binding MarR family transcriptional regulator
MKWELYSFVSRSGQRVRIIKAMTKPMRPTDIARETKLNKSHVSRTLREFVDKGIAKCLTPNERMGKYYELTEEGKKLLKKLESA